MSYDEWIDSINTLVNKNDIEIKDKLLNEKYNENLVNQLEPKLVDLIKIKFNKSVNNIIGSLDDILSDNYSLDLALLEFRKKVKFIYELTDIKELSDEKKELLKNMIIEESDRVFDILLKNARITDSYGILEQTIKNNRIKWS